MKRGLRLRVALLMVLCLCSVPLALASPNVIFDKSISHDYKLELNGTAYTVHIGEGNHSLVRLVSSSQDIHVDVGDCIERGYSEFCYEEYLQDQKIQANLTDFRPVITVDRDISGKKLDLGEESIITLTFENTGGTIIKDFVFTESIPPLLTLVSADGCKISKDDDQKIIFEEKLYLDTPTTCEYVVKAADVGLVVYEGKLFTDTLVSSSDADAIPQVSITTKNVFNFKVNVSQTHIDVGQPFLLNFEIENIETGSKGDNLSIDGVTIYLDDDFQLYKTYPSDFSFFSTSKKLEFSGLIPAESTWEQKVELQSLHMDENFSLEIFVTYHLGDGDEKSFKQVIPFTQHFEPLYCSYVVVDDAGNNLISLDKLNHTLPGYDRGELLVYVYNDNYYVSIDNIQSHSSGDVDLPSRFISSLRKNDKELLTSALFEFDKASSFTLTSDMSLKYNVLGESFSSSCKGNVFVESPNLLSFNKELSFINTSIEEGFTKLIPHVQFSLKNDFFLPVDNIEITEVLPANVFSNNNTKKTVSLGSLEDAFFEFDFIVPADYISIDGGDIILTTSISYEIYGASFIDEVDLAVNVNDVISAQEGIILDSLIDAKIKQLTSKINDSLVAETLKNENLSVEASEPPITYSPFLDYFSYALFVFLFLLGLVFLNDHYGLSRLFKRWIVARKVKKIAKEEENFAKKYESFKTKEGSITQQLTKGKSVLKSLQKDYASSKKVFRKNMKQLRSKEFIANAALEKEQKEMLLLQHQKQSLDNKVAHLNRQVMAQEAKKQKILVERSNAKSLLARKEADVLKASQFVSQTQERLKRLDSYLGTIKSDFELSYGENKSVLDKKLKKVKGDISHLDEQYNSKRKLLKEEEKHLEHREE